MLSGINGLSAGPNYILAPATPYVNNQTLKMTTQNHPHPTHNQDPSHTRGVLKLLWVVVLLLWGENQKVAYSFSSTMIVKSSVSALIVALSGCVSVAVNFTVTSPSPLSRRSTTPAAVTTSSSSVAQDTA